MHLIQKQKAILLLGGSKQNDKRWYTKNIKIADKIYCEYLISLKGD